MNSPMFLANLTSIRHQLIASFSSDKRHKVSGLKSRILIGATASTFVQTTTVTTNAPSVQTLHQAFLDQSVLDIRYKKESGEISNRSMEPHYMLLNYPVWYVLAFDHLRSAPRVFRCDRILSAKVSDARFRLLPKAKFQQSLEGNDVI